MKGSGWTLIIIGAAIALLAYVLYAAMDACDGTLVRGVVGYVCIEEGK